VDTEGTGMTGPSAESRTGRAPDTATEVGATNAPSTSTGNPAPPGSTPTQLPGVKLPASSAPASGTSTPRNAAATIVPQQGAAPAPANLNTDKGKNKPNRAERPQAIPSSRGPAPLPLPLPPTSRPSGSGSRRSPLPAPDRVRFSSPDAQDYSRLPVEGDPDVAFSLAMSPGRPGILRMPSSPHAPHAPAAAPEEPMGATPSISSPPGTPEVVAAPHESVRRDSARREAGVHQPLLHVEPSLVVSPSVLPLSGFPDANARDRPPRESSASQARSFSSGIRGRPLAPVTGIAFEHEAVQPYVEDILVKTAPDKLSLYKRVLRLSQTALDKHFVEDLGVRLQDDPIQIYRFKINGDLLDELHFQITRLQQLSTAISRYVPKPHFNNGQIDPGGYLVRSLQGSSDLALLHIDYKVLTRRIIDAAERIRQLDGRDHVSDVDVSPVQTASSWAADLVEHEGSYSPTHVTKTYLKHPRLQAQMSSPGRAVLDNWLSSNQRSPPAEGWSPLFSTLMPSPTLRNSFPSREPEREPRKVYYPAQSDVPATAFQSGASSYGQPRNWRVPRVHRESSEEREVEGLLADSSGRHHSRDHPSRRERRAAAREAKADLADAKVRKPRDSFGAPSAIRALRAGPEGPDGSDDSSSEDEDRKRRDRGPGRSSRSSKRAPPPRDAAGAGVPPPYGPLSGEPPDWSDGPSSPSSSEGETDDKSRRRDKHANSMRLDTKISTKDLPSWDGGGLTAIDFFYDIDRLSDKGRRVRKSLGRYLPDCLASGSEAQMFYDTAPPTWKRYMRSLYTRFVWTFQRYFLTDRWTIEMTNIANLQRFRQRGHEQEQPVAYLNRRIRFIRVLGLAVAGSQGEVTEMLRFAPPSWKGLLDQRSILTVYQTAAFHLEQLVEMANVFTRSSDSRFDDARLLRALGRLGVQATQPATRRAFVPRKAIGGPIAHANHASTDGAGNDDAAAFISEYDGAAEAEEDEPMEEDANEAAHDGAMAEVYAILKKKPPTAPTKYAWSKRDDIKTATGKLPPYGCRQCGSEKHWNRCQPKSAGLSVQLEETAGSR
jgi:hypothetical protein